MKRLIIEFLFSGILLALSPALLIAQSGKIFPRLRSIELLVANQAAVLQLFSEKQSATGANWSEYNFPDGRVTFYFSSGPCGAGNRDGWDVPKGTLTRIFFEPSNDVTPESLKIDLTDFCKYEVSDAPGQFSYENPKIGVDVGVLETGNISIIEIYPASNLDEKFSCTSIRRE
jgi:hypothetical protein